MARIEKLNRVTMLTTEVKIWSQRLRKVTDGEVRTAIARKLASMTEEPPCLSKQSRIW